MLSFSECYHKYVPESGFADTVGGELLRALNYLQAQFEEENERLGCSDYAEAYVNPAGRYIYRMIDDAAVRNALDKCWGKDAFSKLMKYQVRLGNLLANIWKWICAHPECFTTPNTSSYEDELECPLDAKNAVGFDFSREYGASLNKAPAKKRR